MSSTKVTMRTLGKSKLQVTEVGLGCWQLGGDFGPIDESKATDIVDTALEQGIRFFDTADVYGAGQSERYLGQVLSNQPHDTVIATKYGRAQGVFPNNYSFNSLRDSVLRSQDRLQRDQIDLLQLHCVPHEELQKRHIFDWLEEMKLEGQIAHYGASVETLEEAKTCLEHAPGLTSLQIIFNLMRQQATTDLFDEAAAKDVGIIVRLPLASGMLTGKFDKNTTFDESDHRNFNRNGDAFSVGETFSGIEFEKGLELVNKLDREFKPNSLKMAQFAMRWILDHNAVSTIIPGASSPSQVTQNAAVSAIAPLDEALHKKLYTFYQQDIAPAIRCPV
ncbi:aldo/keto reductase [Salinimonas sediminis]|uniref:Aldo/keto reductase n=1 Tax=Salinimonas sediminis TaxID=2303538 RepID=A0A346NRB3_9ALTE|nr:aldo/keto reductase [Salinimonas sediminis]AXR08070.1 aldo/keto reductase [Salinimonas sediminis]